MVKAPGWRLVHCVFLQPRQRHQTFFKDFRALLWGRAARWGSTSGWQASPRPWWNSTEKELRSRARQTSRSCRTEMCTVCWLPKPSQRILGHILWRLQTAADGPRPPLSCWFRVRITSSTRSLARVKSRSLLKLLLYLVQVKKLFLPRRPRPLCLHPRWRLLRQQCRGWDTLKYGAVWGKTSANRC